MIYRTKSMQNRHKNKRGSQMIDLCFIKIQAFNTNNYDNFLSRNYYFNN